MGTQPHRNVARVVEAARALGLDLAIRSYPEGTRTADDAARAIGVHVGQIVKSLAFAVHADGGAADGSAEDGPGRAAGDGEIVMALVSGDNRLDAAKLADAAGAQRASRADADAVRAATGFPIGGVPPFGHATPLRIFVDRDLLGYDEVWAAAGTPRDNFAITPDELVRVTAATVCDLAERSL